MGLEMGFVSVRVFDIKVNLLIAPHQNRIAICVLDDFALTSKEVFKSIYGIIELRCPLCGKGGGTEMIKLRQRGRNRLL